MTREEDERLYPAIDRWQEAHFFLHGMEQHYHFADPFRWHLNTFLRAIKEVPQLIGMGLQNRPGFPAWFAGRRSDLSSDSLVRYLSEQRDFIVHQGMLKPKSGGFIGVTEGRGMKVGITIPIDPLEDSDVAMKIYLDVVRERGDFIQILQDDDDSLPAVERRWRLEGLGDEDVVDICARAWLRVGSLISEVFLELGGPDQAPDLKCRHDIRSIRVRAYDREDLRRGNIKGFRVR